MTRLLIQTSEFPSLSNNAQMSNPNQSSMWSTAGSRNLGGPSQRNQATPQQGGQDDMFSPTSSRGQGGFRFGNQGNIGQQTQSSSVDDFPPLNQTSNGEMGSDRTASLMSSLGFGSQAGAGPTASNRGNGLLNALSANSRTNEARSPPGIGAPGSSRPQDGKPPGLEEPRQKSSKDDAVPDDASNAADYNTADFSATNYVAQTMQKRLDTADVIDPLEGMPASDKWGLKGLTTLMNNYPDYHAMVVGMDPNSLGLDINSQELFSTQIYSLFDDAPPRPALSNGRFRLPDCYNVTNVQPIESKIQSFNEETLFWIFYSCTADVKQQMAAVELHSRNWRWHKKHQIWLTKDEHMTPQILSPNHERGYYVVWDTNSWRKERIQRWARRRLCLDRRSTYHRDWREFPLVQPRIPHMQFDVTVGGAGISRLAPRPLSSWDYNCTYLSSSRHLSWTATYLGRTCIVSYNSSKRPPLHCDSYIMADDQISLPYLLAILVVSGLIIRYLFFGGPSPPQPTRSPEAFLRSREIAVERIQQMFPQADRRSILWDLQRNGGNIQSTTERILAGRLDTPPVTFQPPPPPGQSTPSSSAATATRQPDKPAQPDLITRYNLKDKLDTTSQEEQDAKGKGWSSNRDERQASLQRRRDEMILAARRKMEAKLAAEKAAQGN
ncbi:uncharacterized protein BKA55DRAFT_594634 [Fusarium redolens]|uniref:Coupling of ubiquitin conjugation to ER degradation protein 1 n=1 Tax=Fusarium redolens TaxID=48865 RepID=A0A9P9H140_FUSRE|nr:uncharacterized protein BKA55DRAFT_594634 [Fusarium redolens]KAH7248751.1 hypothetical protein BKA55DRAFT_594634 [Fusarium redolens]